MQLTTFLSAAATVATASALGAVSLDKACDTSKPYARVINRCDYTVNLWSIMKGTDGSIGCQSAAMVTLKKGEIYNENYQINANDPSQGVSIKISKTESCTNQNLVQLEYFLATNNPGFEFNYLDVSYVDCTGNDCPTKKEGYYLAVGNQTARAVKTTSNNSWCPVLSCSNADECAKMSYINPDDVQTKTCDLTSSMDFYMCGGEAPGDETPASSAPAYSAPASSAPAKSSKKASSPASQPSTTLVPVVSSANDYNIKIAAVTPAPKNDDAAKPPKVKTKVVYVTEYANAKRHEHAHARRHQPFHA